MCLEPITPRPRSQSAAVCCHRCDSSRVCRHGMSAAFEIQWRRSTAHPERVVNVMSRSLGRAGIASICLTAAGLFLLATTSCSTTERGVKSDETRLDRGWPKSQVTAAACDVSGHESCRSSRRRRGVRQQRRVVQSLSFDLCRGLREQRSSSGQLRSMPRSGQSASGDTWQ